MGSVENKTLRQKRWFQLPTCELSISKQHQSRSTCIRSIYLPMLIRYSRACISYHDCLDRELLLTRKLLNQEFQMVKLKSFLRKFYVRHHGPSRVSGPLWNCRFTDDIGYVPDVVITIPLLTNVTYQIRQYTGFVITWATWWVSHHGGAGSVHPSGAHEITPMRAVLVVFVLLSLVFYVVSCVLLFVCLTFS